MKTLKVLGVHGLGDHRNTIWRQEWETALVDAFPAKDSIKIDFTPLNYDHIFEDTDISAAESLRAVFKLLSSAVLSPFRKHRGTLSDIDDRIKWTAGYVVAWLEDDEFQHQARVLVLDKVKEVKPDLIIAHSLGSLITYNAFTHPDATEKGMRRILRRASYISLGSQIGNVFVVRNLTLGRIVPLGVRMWYHLYNPEDDVFTAQIKLWDTSRFQQIITKFDIQGRADHSAVEYLKNAQTIENVWHPISEALLNPSAYRSRKSTRRIKRRAVTTTRRRALLVGINDYPNPKYRLEGCVNDVFLMSSVLQECGFKPDSIRVCLDSRATTSGIMSRLEWLLDDPMPGDERLFYFSGHGATIPDYGVNNEPDRLTETLVPRDYDWSQDRAVTDDAIWMLYNQLPYETRFAMILDCCHSGGMHRDGGTRVRGLAPPDDIRHRSLKWDTKTEMWVEREFIPFNKHFSSETEVMDAYFGTSRSKSRIGRAGVVRVQSEEKYKMLKRKEKSKKPIGPYLPLILEACNEDEYAYEYQHGVTSYGAFTYSLSSILRRRKRISFNDLVNETSHQLAMLGYSQNPQILGPRKITQARVPWMGV